MALSSCSCARRATGMSSRTGVALRVLILAGTTALPAAAVDWQATFARWHAQNGTRGLGSSSSSELAWFESHLLQAYLEMFAATNDTSWLDQFVRHADTIFALMRDAPDTGDFWPGYCDGFHGWGTSRYDPRHRYQEYLVHDAHICLPIARFIRLILAIPGLQPRFIDRARHYLDRIECHIIAKWYSNWYADRGSGEALSEFGGWQTLPLNQSLVFGELLLTLSEPIQSPLYLRRCQKVPGSFYQETPNAMVQLFRQSLQQQSQSGAYVWSYWPWSVRTDRWEDISHANLDISFAIACHENGKLFFESDLAAFGNTLVLMWNGSTHQPRFSYYVNGTGGLDSTHCLASWLRLCRYQPLCYWLVSAAMADMLASLPDNCHSSVALVMATLARFQPLFKEDASPFSFSLTMPSQPGIQCDIATQPPQEKNGNGCVVFDLAGRRLAKVSSAGLFFTGKDRHTRQRLVSVR